MGWIFRSARESFARYSDMWDDINRSVGNHILLDSMFVAPLIRHFRSPGTLLGVSTDSKNPGMALVNETKKSFWQTFQPAQEPVGLILLGNKADVSEQIDELIRSLPGHAFGFAVLQQDPDCTVFKNLTPCKKIETVSWRKTARVTLTGTFEDYWKRRSKNLIKDLARQRRRLADNGLRIELIADHDPARVVECIEEYAELERQGWKGREGTAVTASNLQGRFYREILENFCARGEGVIYRLLMNGRTVACELCIERDGMLVDLKTTYDEGLSGVSPGSLLAEEMLKAYFSERRIKVVEFYGPVLDWTTKWTDEIRTMSHINFYRQRWVPVARRFLKRSLQLIRCEEK